MLHEKCLKMSINESLIVCVHVVRALMDIHTLWGPTFLMDTKGQLSLG